MSDAGDAITRRVVHGFYPRRSGDVILMYDSFKYLESGFSVATHGSPYSYGTNVPVIIMGQQIRPGNLSGRRHTRGYCAYAISSAACAAAKQLNGTRASGSAYQKVKGKFMKKRALVLIASLTLIVYVQAQRKPTARPSTGQRLPAAAATNR
ncbi:MAG: hypothetical protein WKF84_02175 [Pyrinomonadaceae bacterium]